MVITQEQVNKVLATNEKLDYEEGVGYYFEADGTINVPENNMKLAGAIMRTINESGAFDAKLVRLNKTGDDIVLGFDNLATEEAVRTFDIGVGNAIHVDVKQDKSKGKYYVYIDGKRQAKPFTKMTVVARYVNAMNKKLKSTMSEAKGYEDDSED